MMLAGSFSTFPNTTCAPFNQSQGMKVKKNWDPPLKSGGESPATIAQTSVMLTLAFVFGKDFLGVLTPEQRIAVDFGCKLFEEVLVYDTVSQKEGAD